MKPRIFPPKLSKGDEVRIIAPGLSFAILSKETIDTATGRLNSLGLKVSFGKHIGEKDEFTSSPIESRLDDLHEAFSDKAVKAVLTVIGGFNSNQLLEYIDWSVVAKNTKIFCGFSDITVLANAIFAKTGLITFSGPHYSTFGQKLYFDYTLDYFRKCLLEEGSFKIEPSLEWSDDKWYLDQNDRKLIKNDGFWVINEGKAKGTIVGGNLCTLNLLQGTEYMPDLSGSILFLEDDYTSKLHDFDRNLQSLVHLPEFKEVRGIIIGRFQKESQIKKTLLIKSIKNKKDLDRIPVVANVDFGHTDPKITFPIGGEVEINADLADLKDTKISIIKH